MYLKKIPKSFIAVSYLHNSRFQSWTEGLLETSAAMPGVLSMNTRVQCRSCSLHCTALQAPRMRAHLARCPVCMTMQKDLLRCPACRNVGYCCDAPRVLRPWESTGGRVLSPPMHVEFIRAHVQVCSICKRMFHDIVFGAPREPDEQHANTALQNKCCIILPVGATAEDI